MDDYTTATHELDEPFEDVMGAEVDGDVMLLLDSMDSELEAAGML